MPKAVLQFAALLMMLPTPTMGRAYVLEFTEDGEGAAPDCVFYPVNCRMWAADFVGVRAALFRESPANPGFYYAEAGPEWGGPSNGGVPSVWLYLNGRAKATYRNGHLVAFERPDDAGSPEADREILTRYVPHKERSSAVRKKADHRKDGRKYWAKSGRLRLWYDNPNAAGTLFAELALLAFAAVLFARRRWAKAVALLAMAGLVAALGMTQSRGSAIAFAAGAAVLLLPFVLGLRRTALRRALLAAYAAALLGAAVLSPVVAAATARRDRSSSLRLDIWADAPRMMAIAPEGWRTATGYVWCEWFQALDDDFTTAWMVNSHLSWMVQYGRAFRLLYVAGWLFALSVLASGLFRRDGRGRKSHAFALSQCAGLFTAAWFSTVGPFPEFWAAPAAAFALAVAVGRPSARRLAVLAASSVALSALILVCVELHGRASDRNSPLGGMIARTEHGVKIGKGEAKNVLVHDNMVLTGGHHGGLGKDLREYYQRHPDAPATLVANGLKSVPDGVDTLVLAGRAADAYVSRCRKQGEAHAPFKPRRLVLLSPAGSWKKIPEWLLGETEVSYITGEFAVRGFRQSGKPPPSWVTVVPGASVYVRDWTERVNGR